MKEKDAKIDFKEHEIILFTEKEDESYGATQTGSYATKNFLDDYFFKKKNLDKELRADMEKGKFSPVYYYMLMQDIGQGDLAKRVGISRRKLKKHFSPEDFANLNDKMLEKYAVVFGVSVQEMMEVGSKK